SHISESQNVFNTSVLWTPTEFDIDVDVSHAGTHQVAWGQSQDFTAGEQVDTSKFKGFSQGFNVKASVNATSSSIQTSTVTPVTSSSPVSAAHNDKISTGTVIGLAVG